VNETLAGSESVWIWKLAGSDFVLGLQKLKHRVKYVVTADDKLIDGQVGTHQNNLVSFSRGCSR
jgi:hypothetical protein